MKINIIIFLLGISVFSAFGGVGYKGIHKVVHDSQYNYAYFPVIYDRWVDYNIGVVDLNKKEVTSGINITNDFPGYRLIDIQLFNDKIIAALLTNYDYFSQDAGYRYLIVMYSVETSQIIDSLTFINKTIDAFYIDKKYIYLLFNTGLFRLTDKIDNKIIYEKNVKIGSFPKITANNEIFAIYYYANVPRFYEIKTGVEIYTVTSEPIQNEDIFLTEDNVFILFYNRLEVYSRDWQLIDSHPFKSFGISPAIDLVNDFYLVFKSVKNGNPLYYLYSIKNKDYKSINIESDLYISTAEQINNTVFIFGLSEIVGVFEMPRRKPDELISIQVIDETD